MQTLKLYHLKVFCFIFLNKGGKFGFIFIWVHLNIWEERVIIFFEFFKGKTMTKAIVKCDGRVHCVEGHAINECFVCF